MSKKETNAKLLNDFVAKRNIGDPREIETFPCEYLYCDNMSSSISQYASPRMDKSIVCATCEECAVHIEQALKWEGWRDFFYDMAQWVDSFIRKHYLKIKEPKKVSIQEDEDCVTGYDVEMPTMTEAEEWPDQRDSAYRRMRDYLESWASLNTWESAVRGNYWRSLADSLADAQRESNGIRESIRGSRPTHVVFDEYTTTTSTEAMPTQYVDSDRPSNRRWPNPEWRTQASGRMAWHAVTATSVNGDGSVTYDSSYWPMTVVEAGSIY